MKSDVHRRARGLMRSSLAGRITPAQSAWLTAHLLGCQHCMASYERLLVVAELDPAALPARIRTAVGLGITAPAGAARRWLLPLAGGLVAAAALLLIFFLGPGTGAGPSSDGFATRSVNLAKRNNALEVYRLAASGTSLVTGGAIAPYTELAFAYRNPAGKKRLMVFARDDGGEVYWYYPAWTSGDVNPVAVPIEPAPGLVELPEAVRHRVRGSRLTLYALFTDRELSVRQVEARLSSSAGAEPSGGGDVFFEVVEVEVKHLAGGPPVEGRGLQNDARESP